MQAKLLDDSGKEIEVVDIKEKAFKTGAKGYYANGIVVVKGKAHRYSVMLIEIGSKKVK